MNPCTRFFLWNTRFSLSTKILIVFYQTITDSCINIIVLTKEMCFIRVELAIFTERKKCTFERLIFYGLSILKIGMGSVFFLLFLSLRAKTFTESIAPSFHLRLLLVLCFSKIWCFCMQVGTTSSTAVDPLPELGTIAKVSTFFPSELKWHSFWIFKFVPLLTLVFELSKCTFWSQTSRFTLFWS